MPKTKEMKRENAKKLKEIRDGRSIDQQLSILNSRPGNATKERTKLINQKKAIKAEKNQQSNL